MLTIIEIFRDGSSRRLKAGARVSPVSVGVRQPGQFEDVGPPVAKAGTSRSAARRFRAGMQSRQEEE